MVEEVFIFKEDEMRRLTKRFSFLASFVFAGTLSPVLAQTAITPSPTPAGPTVTVDGLVDAYYNYNFTNSAHSLNGHGNGPLYSFNQADNSYTLGLAEASLTATQGTGSAHLTLAYGETASLLGQAATVLGGAPAPDHFFVEQAYVSYTAGLWTFNIGKFVTWMSNEVIESKSNWNYSRSLLYYYTGIFHTGLSLGYAPSTVFSVTGYAVNGWNNDSADNIAGEKTYGLQASIKPDAAWSFVLNGSAGPNPFSATDGSTNLLGEAILSCNATDKLSFALDSEYDSQALAQKGAIGILGVALYGRYQIQGDWAAALRLEELSDDHGGSPAVSSEVREATLTLEHNLTPNTLLRLEGRYDYALAGGAILPAGSGPYAAGDPDQLTGTFSTVFSF